MNAVVRRAVTTAAAIALTAGVFSCVRPATPNDHLPDLPSVRSRLSDPMASLSAAEPPPRLFIHRVTWPLSASLESLWELVETDGLPNGLPALWQANGMRLGTIGASRLLELGRLFDRADRITTTMLVGARHFAPQPTSPPLRRPVQIDLIERFEGPERISIARGRMQWLIRAQGGDDGQVHLELVPHHHFKKFSLTPRSPLQTQQDGRTFEALGLTTVMRPGRLLVMGLYLPAPVQPEPELEPQETLPAHEGQAETDKQSHGHEDPDRPASGGQSLEEKIAVRVGNLVPGSENGLEEDGAEAALPSVTESTGPSASVEVSAHLGRLLFTASRLNHPLQVVVVIGIESKGTE